VTLSFDEEYFESVGLSRLSAEGKKSLVAAINAETEFRVGAVLAGRFNDEQLAEFERIIDKDEATVRKVLDELDHDNY